MPYYRVCPFCGSNLDPGERCDCRTEKGAEHAQRAAVRPDTTQAGVNTHQGRKAHQTPAYKPQKKVC